MTFRNLTEPQISVNFTSRQYNFDKQILLSAEFERFFVTNPVATIYISKQN